MRRDCFVLDVSLLQTRSNEDALSVRGEEAGASYPRGVVSGTIWRSCVPQHCFRRLCNTKQMERCFPWTSLPILLLVELTLQQRAREGCSKAGEFTFNRREDGIHIWTELPRCLYLSSTAANSLLHLIALRARVDKRPTRPVGGSLLHTESGHAWNRKTERKRRRTYPTCCLD